MASVPSPSPPPHFLSFFFKKHVYIRQESFNAKSRSSIQISLSLKKGINLLTYLTSKSRARAGSRDVNIISSLSALLFCCSPCWPHSHPFQDVLPVVQEVMGSVIADSPEFISSQPRHPRGMRDCLSQHLSIKYQGKILISSALFVCPPYGQGGGSSSRTT